MNNDKATIQKLLIDLGFSRSAAESYWALLNLETVSIRKVAAFTDINRGTTYEALKDLRAAGLVMVRKSGEREYFSAASPEKIYDLIKDRRKQLWESQQQAQQIIPKVIARHAKPVGTPLVQYYEDDDGVVAILRDVLQTTVKLQNPEYCVFSSKPVRQYLYRKFPSYTDRRITEGITVRAIAIGEGGEQADRSERRWLPESTDSPVTSYTLIYGNKVAQISITEQMPYGVVIEDAGMAAMQQLLFEQVWNKLA